MTATNAAGRNLQTAAGATDDGQTVAAARLMSTYSKDAVAKAKAYGFAACATGMQPGIEAVLGGASGAVKNSFVAKATTRCLTAMEAVTSLAKPKTGPELSRFVAESTAMFDKLTVDMKALPVAPGDEGTVAEMFVAVEKANAKMKEVGAAAVAGDLKRMNTLQKEFDALDDAAGAKLEGYGLNVCGYNT
jgi:uncharacterized protein YqgV (UPF0045/DUF77 family)